MSVRLILLCALGWALQAVCAAEEAYRWDLPTGFPRPYVPASNPMSDAKARLGRHLFYDQRLSGNGTQSCATCHRQELAFTDGRATSIGTTGQTHSRSAMSLVNAGYNAVLTWSDPSLRLLEDQVSIPLFSEHPVELGLRGREQAVLISLRSEPVYRALFPKAFPEAKNPFNLSNVAKALATFERTIISARSPYDRYYNGGEPNAISDSAKRGEVLFFNDVVAGCYRCHGGFNFSDATRSSVSANVKVEFHNTGLYNLPGAISYPSPNLGIYEHTRKLTDVGKFKAPSLRSVALTAPYMHDGSIATLEEVLDHYAAGGRGHDNPHKDARMTGIVLTAQNREDLLAFLQSLTDTEVTRDPRFSNPW